MDSLSEVIQMLKSWADEPHDTVCNGPYEQKLACRHDRARTALVQVENAMDEIHRLKRTKATSKGTTHAE